MRRSGEHSYFVDFMGGILKRFVLSTFILMLISMVLGLLGDPSLTIGFLILIFPFFLKIGLTIVCFTAIAITLEALGPI